MTQIVQLAIELSDCLSKNFFMIKFLFLVFIFQHFVAFATFNFMPFVTQKSTSFSTQYSLNFFCREIDAVYQRLGWKKSPCLSLPWSIMSYSGEGRPLIYLEFNGTSSKKPYRSCSSRSHNTTLFLGGVHPDELTPIYIAFEFAKALHQNPSLYKNAKVIVAPLVNPDGFMKNPPSRANHKGVDVNRNFPTENWLLFAYKSWIQKDRRDPRKNPGNLPASEKETQFQLSLMSEFNPDKIISFHAPLYFLDLDYEISCSYEQSLALTELISVFKMRKEMAKATHHHRIKDYGVFAGSLGKYSGFERSIPTFTLELETSNPKEAERLWRQTAPGLHYAIQYNVMKEKN